MYQFGELFKDPQTYFIAVIVTAMNISDAAISSFSALIIKSFGYTTKESELLTIPGGVVSTKKVTMNAIVLMSFCLGNILGPLTFRTEDEPDYIPAKIAIVATVSVAIVFSVPAEVLLYGESGFQSESASSPAQHGSDSFDYSTNIENSTIHH
ncbi:hypothetical protein CNMCM5623_004684 [Aspergillus felis]|uniref:Uncharacterized protein n=1 Tax=Aspergillus felis TaxID=1287682 RepID=A0A8H6QPM1_9EURO|nr:hypothetical protein CNMCM5623_004684 [Aspergillus felis]KAF7175982.1 hypothetical protein CNMCM7691_000833 [Aspergillus felis]